MSPPIRVLELRSVWGTGGGPDKTILAGARLSNPSDVAVTVCYLRDDRDAVFALDRRAAELGLDYVEIRERHSFDPRVWPALRALVRARQIDIVHAHDHKTDALTWALAKMEPIIPLSTAHGFSGYSRNEKLYYAIEKKLLARFPRVIAVSRPIRDELVRTGSKPDRITIINNGIDHRSFVRDTAHRLPTRRSLAIAENAPLIGAVGRLEWEKRFDVLLDAFSRLRTRHPHVVLAIVGEGSLRGALEGQAAALRLGQSVQFLGHRTDIAALHAAFDFFVQSSEREGTPNAVLEAMALETPLVATDVGGTAELVTHGIHGLLVLKNNIEALSTSLDQALSKPDDSRERAQAARQRVERELSFEERMRRVERVYGELVASRTLIA
jgi:glycosyltransferase involved in cell wall biosynthesis